MELRSWAIQILSADCIEKKLLRPKALTDREPGDKHIFKEPVRPPGMEFQKRKKEDKLPSFQELDHPDKRAVCLHRFAGHELLAVEMFAYALLAFPKTPRAFRMGIANALKEEQVHVSLYKERLKDFNLNFGDLPLYRHFWAHVKYLTDPIKFISTLNLTFEMANLDFAPLYSEAFEKYGDLKSAALLKQILFDEIKHVAFGFRWFKKLKQSTDQDFQYWKDNLSPLLTPKRAKGFVLMEENRRKASVSEEWITEMKKY